jgi:hypothetical protein
VGRVDGGGTASGAAVVEGGGDAWDPAAGVEDPAEEIPTGAGGTGTRPPSVGAGGADGAPTAGCRPSGEEAACAAPGGMPLLEGGARSASSGGVGEPHGVLGAAPAPWESGT